MDSEISKKKIWVFSYRDEPIIAFSLFDELVKYYIENHVVPHHTKYKLYWDNPNEDFVYRFYRPYVENSLDLNNLDINSITDWINEEEDLSVDLIPLY